MHRIEELGGGDTSVTTDPVFAPQWVPHLESRIPIPSYHLRLALFPQDTVRCLGGRSRLVPHPPHPSLSLGLCSPHSIPRLHWEEERGPAGPCPSVTYAPPVPCLLLAPEALQGSETQKSVAGYSVLSLYG